MVWLAERKVLGIILLFLLPILLSSFANAQAMGCCCEDSNNAIYPILENSCSAVDEIGGFSSNIATQQDCNFYCLDACDISTDCSSPVSSTCICGQEIAETGEYCLIESNGAEIYTEYQVNNGECDAADSTDPETFTISGYVTDRETNKRLNDAQVSLANRRNITNSNGYYSLKVLLSEVNDGASIVAKNIGYYDLAFEINSNNDTVNFSLETIGSEPACEGTCQSPCGPNQVCIDDNDIVYEFNNNFCQDDGAVCYPVSCTCTDIDPGDGGGEPELECSLGDCSVVNNRYCNSSYMWEDYDLDNDQDFNDYCDRCGELDSDCTTESCNADGICNGVCDSGCGPTDDPDCGSACDFGGAPRWCSGDGFVSPSTTEENRIIYCDHCSNSDVAGYCVETGDQPPDQGALCGNGELDPNFESCDDSMNNADANCPAGYTCNGCSCEPDACFGPASIDDVSAQGVELEWNISVAWVFTQNSCPIDLTKLEVLRCQYSGQGSAGTCNPEKIVKSFTEDIPVNYMDPITKDQGNTRFCYSIKTYSEEGQSETEPVCVMSGDSYCIEEERQGNFCDSNSVANCVYQQPDMNHLNIVESCSSDKFCQLKEDESGEVITQCVSAGPCQECNSLYELYGTTQAGLLQQITYDNNPNLVCQQLVNIGVCGPDKTVTSVDKLSDCSVVNSCYDYKRKDACNSNPCNKFNSDVDTGNSYGCEWEPVADSFGLGICKPVDFSKQDCTRCYDNPVFPYCDETICEAHGECYYNPENGGSPSCTSSLGMSCRDYANEVDCINGQNYSMNYTDNSVISYSNDKFEMGKCKWDGTYLGNCYRDADDSSDTLPLNEEKDCPSVEGGRDLNCELDFENPVTNVNISDGQWLGGSFTARLGAGDSNYPSCELETYYCNSSVTDGCASKDEFELVDSGCPNYNPVIRVEGLTTNSNKEDYFIKYYSKDPAENYEVIKTTSFYIDGKMPELENFEYDYNSYQTGDDEWRSDLNISLGFDENVTCNMNLTNNGEIVTSSYNNDVSDVRSEIFNLKYYSLADSNNYNLNLDCKDDRGNPSVNESVRMTIEGDKSITNPQPNQLITTEQEVTISVETANDATCRFSTETTDYHSMEGEIWNPDQRKYQGIFLNDNNKYHFRTLTFDVGSSVFRFYTACNITYWNASSNSYYSEITEGNDGDVIWLSIDRVAPLTFLSYYNNTENTWTQVLPRFFEDKYFEYMELKFECVDQKTDPVYGSDWSMNKLGFDGTFGCANLIFCSGQGCNPQIQDNIHKDITLNDANTQENYTFRYSSNDTGGNTESLKNLQVNIDNVESDFTFKVYQDGEPVNILTQGEYTVVVNTSKPISEVLRLEYKKDGSDAYGLDVYRVEDYNFTADLSITDDVFFGEQGNIVLEAEILDYHNVHSEGSSEPIPYNNRDPDAPQLNPIFNPSTYQGFAQSLKGYKDNLGRWYPFTYLAGEKTFGDVTYQNVYFINKPSLFVTGTTNMLGVVKFFLDTTEQTSYDQTLEENLGIFEYKDVKNTYNDQDPNNEYYEKGTNNLILPGHIQEGWNESYFLALSPAGRNAYGYFGKFYKITSKDTSLTNPDRTSINIEPALERDVAKGSQAYLYNKSHLEEWFGANLTFTYNEVQQNNYHVLYLIVEDELGNQGTTQQWNLFFDNRSPELIKVTPDSTTTIVDEYQPITFTVKEPIGGAGIYNQTIRFTINNEEKLVTVEGVGNEYNITYTPVSPWEDGAYNVNLELVDFAGNKLDSAGAFGEVCYNSMDGCCLSDDDSVCDPDCGYSAVSGKYLNESDSNCNPTDCTSQTGDCCRIEYDGIIDLDCEEVEADVDECEGNVCDLENNVSCINGQWNETNYCSLNNCGMEDPDCFECDAAHEGVCKYENNTWCHNNYWVEEGFNTQCGIGTSSCLDLSYTYECVEGACDTENDLVCDENGYWTSENYASECGYLDSTVGSGCTDGTCDPSSNNYCDESTWISNNCDYTGCQAVDYDCNETAVNNNVDCQAGFCDVSSEYYCDTNNNFWTNDTYAADCGSEDYDYGCMQCADDTCDTLNNKYCDGGVWTGVDYCDISRCYGEDSECASQCTETVDNCCSPGGSECDPDCTQYQDAECGTCTSSAGDCCVPEQNDICDPDCTITPDPDCNPGAVFEIDKNAPATPIFTLEDAVKDNQDNWVLEDNQPTFELDFTFRSDGEEERLNITTPTIEIVSSPASVSATCSKMEEKNFSCGFNQQLSDGQYIFEARASKMLNNGSLGPEGIYAYRIVVDTQTPIFTLSHDSDNNYIDPNESLVIIAAVENEDFNLQGSISVQGQDGETAIDPEKNGDNYVFVIPADFEWGDAGDKTLVVTLEDFAGHSDTKEINIIVDDDEPTINIINFVADPIIVSGKNITVANQTIIVAGQVPIDTEKICSEKGGVIDHCINRSSGEYRIIGNTFTMELTIQRRGTLEEKALVSTDYARHAFRESIYVLLDLEPPSPPEITLVNR